MVWILASAIWDLDIWAHFLAHDDYNHAHCGEGQMQQPGGNFGYRDMRVLIGVFGAIYRHNAMMVARCRIYVTQKHRKSELIFEGDSPR